MEENTQTTDRALQDDVHRLGDMLGEVIRAHGGEALFQQVETMRRAAKTARESSDETTREGARETLTKAAAGLSPRQALDVARAFTLYFRLVNVAEDVHRTRLLRHWEMEGAKAHGPERGTAAVPESLLHTVDDMVAAGANRESIEATLQDLHIRCVFTAHPTEARRRTTERLLRDVRVSLEEKDRRAHTATEEFARERRLRATVESLWEHASERGQRPEVLEEVKAGLWYIEMVLFDAVPKVQRRLAKALEVNFGPRDPAHLPLIFSFGSWMGSDRDGNPFVNEEVTDRTLDLQRRTAIGRYIRDLDSLVDPLSAAKYRMPPSAGLERALQQAENALPDLIFPARGRNPDEPFRRLLTFMRERLVRTLSGDAGAYSDVQAFLADLEVLREGLREIGATALPDDGLLDVILRVRCFGFVLAPLDIREDSRVHRQVMAELLRDPDYPNRSTEERIQALASLELPPGAKLSSEARRLLQLFESIGKLKTKYGPECLGTYIISMAETSADVLEVLRLAELHRIENEIDIVPLLETRQALSQAKPLLTSLFGLPRYREHIKRRSDTQEVIFGYSDSMKEAGILASRVAVLDAQDVSARICRDHGIQLRVFHGRGGSVSRGGGPTHRAIRALPRNLFSGQVKITEQGEVRSFHFANPDLAARYLEQTVGAGLFTLWEAKQNPEPMEESDRLLLADLAERSYGAYRSLVEDDGLIPYFTQVTPLDQIAALNIASRPSKRSQSTGLSSLRAIPWVFAWSQARHVITGWYGVGAALEGGDRTRVQALYDRNPFFRDLLDNVQMTLAKADLPIARRYSQMCDDEGIRTRIFGRVEDEFHRVRSTVLGLRGEEDLLDDDPRIKKSIRLRNPYIDTLSYLQIEALHRIRAADEDTALWQRVCRLTIKGIAAGLRNTG